MGGMFRALIAALATTLLLAQAVAAPRIPSAAYKYEDTLVREARYAWGLNAPIALLAAQIHQESAWRPDVCSPYACGLTQFTPGTAGDMCRWYPSLCPVNVYDAGWAIRAQVTYDKRLYDLALPHAATECDAFAMMLAAYNGGWGWVLRDIALTRKHNADPTRWWDNVENYSSRASWAFKENRAYPRRIVYVLQPVYSAAGWGGETVCEST